MHRQSRAARPTDHAPAPRGPASARAKVHVALRDPFRLERRREGREAADGLVCASYEAPGRCGITHLRLVDRSASGLGATTRTELEPGTVVTICPEGATTPYVRAVAVRCEPAGECGYRVGLRYCGRAAA
jgi:hypothetical protein